MPKTADKIAGRFEAVKLELNVASNRIKELEQRQREALDVLDARVYDLIDRIDSITASFEGDDREQQIAANVRIRFLGNALGELTVMRFRLKRELAL